MDRAYYQLIDEANEAVRLAVAIVRNADYKPCIKSATDPIIVDVLRELQRTQKTLQEVIKRQQIANDKNT